ncbi:MAG TPA: trypsin-like peptidase domain-containing protein [Drouetiella sp.]|jgi:serine protease Do
MKRYAKKSHRLLPVWLLSLLVILGGIPSTVFAEESCNPSNPHFRSPVFGLQDHIAEAMQVSVHIRTVNKTNFEPEEPVQIQPEHGASGAGFIFDEDPEQGFTYIATDYHVIEGTNRIHVVLADGRKFEGFEVGRDAWLDLTVLKIKVLGLPRARLGSSSSLVVGDWLFSIGSPHYLAFTAVHGMVSAFNRWETHADSIQTDMPIYSGASGGGVFNMCGEVVGKVESAIEHASNLNFVTPSDSFKGVLEKLRKGEKVQHPYMGFDTEKGAPHNFDGPYTHVIVKVQKNFPAWKADLRVGDIVVSIDGAIPDTSDDISRIISRHQPGDVLVFRINRNGNEFDVRVTLTSVPE